MHKTQRDWVIAQLKEHGEVSRNLALSNFISRLGAIMCDLKADGWQFTTERREGNYVYKYLDSPKRKVIVYDLVNGVRVPRTTYVSA